MRMRAGKRTVAILLLIAAVFCAVAAGGTSSVASAGSGPPPSSSAACAGCAIPNLGTAPPPEAVWVSSLLTAIGAPHTPANTASITDWIAHEGRYGTQGENNPMNTTQTEPGSTSFAGLAVQNYPTPTEGLTAIVVTLENGRYPQILAQLRAGVGLLSGAESDLGLWSGGGYYSV
jgi:hypothetical protein